MTVPFHLASQATELQLRFRTIKQGLRGARVRVRTGIYQGRTGEVLHAITSPEALIEATVRLDHRDASKRMRPRIRLGITQFEVI